MRPAKIQGANKREPDTGEKEKVSAVVCAGLEKAG